MTEPVQIGDIVELQGHRWVVASKHGSPQGSPRMARLIRPSRDYGINHSFTTYETAPTFIERPTFTVGQRVSLNGKSGEIVALGPDQHEDTALVRVRWDYYRRALQGGGHVGYHDAHASVPSWLITLEMMS